MRACRHGPGARELIDALARAGTPVAIASNSTRAFVERVLEVSGLPLGGVGAVVTVEDVEHPKPAPDIYLAACRALGAAPAARPRSRTRRRASYRRGPPACT